MPLVLLVRATRLEVTAEHWHDSTLVAKARGGARRLAGHRLVRVDGAGPPWWFHRHGLSRDRPQWITIDPRVITGGAVLSQRAEAAGAPWEVSARVNRLGCLQWPSPLDPAVGEAPDPGDDPTERSTVAPGDGASA